MKVLVTGGAGYLGSILCRKLLEKNYQVRLIDSFWYGKQSINDLLSNPNFEIIDLCSLVGYPLFLVQL